ncbi:MAG TPA: UDP-N-acetylmuramoyl-L-alanine--D-glutamate ligase [Chthoniobacterales bacterium]|nr:UDP-N-acetylmuramoyl-L-alanine--D-glutamate ligase [Chthoniobacterales bacterium]
MNYSGTNIVVLGLGRSGLAAARLLKHAGARVTVNDSGHDERLQKQAALLQSEGITVHLGHEALSDAVAYDQAILSPGIEENSPLVKNITSRGTSLIGELELAYSFCHCPLVAITGTNGKTTTTELTARVLQGIGLRTLACGNIGLPFSEAVMQSADLDMMVVEVSSFQLETIQKFHAKVAIWLNFSPNHLDRYSSLEEYRAAKLKIFNNQTAEDFAVIPTNSQNLSSPSTEVAMSSVAPVLESSGMPDTCRTLRSEAPCSSSAAATVKIGSPLEIPLKARCVRFSAYEQGGDFSLENNSICYRGHPFLKMEQTRLSGAHNAENLMAAFAVGIALTRIFHTNLLRNSGRPMNTALGSGFGLGSMYSYSPAPKSSPALPHQPSQLSRHDQYEISRLSESDPSQKISCLEQMSNAIKEYTPPAHRCELVADVKGVQWINDSKATTLDAMEKAINSIDFFRNSTDTANCGVAPVLGASSMLYTLNSCAPSTPCTSSESASLERSLVEPNRSLILIAGGKNKGFSFKPIASLVKKRVKEVILLGEMSDLIVQDWEGIPCRKAVTMEEAVTMAGDLATAGDTILLSPGTSSYDMFSDYIERGDLFKRAVCNYQGNCHA